MTSQIVILNKQAAVAASDSAATIFRSDGLAKVFAGTQKIFPLGDWPALVMISGSAECDGVPWRTLIDDFRKKTVAATASQPPWKRWRRNSSIT